MQKIILEFMIVIFNTSMMELYSRPFVHHKVLSCVFTNVFMYDIGELIEEVIVHCKFEMIDSYLQNHKQITHGIKSCVEDCSD